MMKSYSRILGLLSVLVSSTCFGVATNGTMGTQSEGAFDVNLLLDPQVLISNFSGDFAVNQKEWRANSFLTPTPVNFCIYSSTASNNYTILASGSTPVSSDNTYGFQANSPTQTPDKDYFQYKVLFYSNASATGTPTELTNKATSTTSSFKGSGSEDCNGSNNASVVLEMAAKNLNSSHAGHYTDTLTLTVAPAV